MSAFPPKTWDVRPLEDMDAMSASPKEGAEHSMQAFLAVHPASGLEGSYRFALTGTNHVTMKVPVQRIIPDQRFKEMVIEIQLQLGTQIKLGKNCTSTDWVDMVELVQSQDADVVDKSGHPISEEFLLAMQDYQNSHPDRSVGICWRWALTAHLKEVALVVQALPCDLDTIKASDILRSDAALGITVGYFALDYDKFESELLEGPVPVLFSSDPAEARRKMEASPQLAFECLQALLSRLLARREITIEEAEAYAANPVLRAERRPFQKEWPSTKEAVQRPDPAPEASGSKNKGRKYIFAQHWGCNISPTHAQFLQILQNVLTHL